MCERETRGLWAHLYWWLKIWHILPWPPACVNPSHSTAPRSPPGQPEKHNNINTHIHTLTHNTSISQPSPHRHQWWWTANSGTTLTEQVLIFAWRSMPPGKRNSWRFELRPAWGSTNTHSYSIYCILYIHWTCQTKAVFFRYLMFYLTIQYVFVLVFSFLFLLCIMSTFTFDSYVHFAATTAANVLLESRQDLYVQWSIFTVGITSFI